MGYKKLLIEDDVKIVIDNLGLHSFENLSIAEDCKFVIYDNNFEVNIFTYRWGR